MIAVAEDCSAIKAKLDAAQAAYDRLVLGGAIRVVVDTDGSRIEYTSANRASLFSYLQMLQVQYDKCTGNPIARVTRPVNFVF